MRVKLKCCIFARVYELCVILIAQQNETNKK